MNEIESYIVKLNSNENNVGLSRYYSFDYCYNYFYNFKSNRIKEISNNDNLQKSCLTLGYYLSSWGMLRGSSFLLKKYSVKIYEPLIKEISINSKFVNLWNIDLNNYDNIHNIKLLLECKYIIKEKLGLENNPSDTLVSKIMLGIFGCVPAFDQFFKKGLNVTGFNEKSLNYINKFYIENKDSFNKINSIYTLDFNSNKNTNIKYPLAKLLDMYGFTKGQNLLLINKNKN